MKTRIANIYHCISCGHVVHTAIGAEAPQCCGHTMAEACAQTIYEDDNVGEPAGRHSETRLPVVAGRMNAW